MEQCPHPHRLAHARRHSAHRRTPELAHVGHCTPSRTASRPTWAAAGSLCKTAYQDDTQLSHHPLAVTGRVALSPRIPCCAGQVAVFPRPCCRAEETGAAPAPGAAGACHRGLVFLRAAWCFCLKIRRGFAAAWCFCARLAPPRGADSSFSSALERGSWGRGQIGSAFPRKREPGSSGWESGWVRRSQ